MKPANPVHSRRTALALAVLASTAWTPLASAKEFPKVIRLSSLDGTIGFKISGKKSDDRSGRSVASAGDVNGDGFADVIVGADFASGASYVVFGKASGFAANLDLSSLDGSNGFKISGEAPYDRSGSSVAGAGDVNGDGFADVIIGADPKSPFPYSDRSGASYVVFGKASGFAANFSLSRLNGSNGFKISKEVGDDFRGISVAGAGDINGDGFADVIVGAYKVYTYPHYSGASYVVFGKASGFAAYLDVSSLDGSNGFKIGGEAAYDRSGSSVAAAGDVNGDGFADVIVGAQGADPHGSLSGASYVVFGKASGFAANLDLSLLDGPNGFKISGDAAYDRIGLSVASAGDVNGDGFADVIVGAPLADPHGTYSGSSYVVFGKASGFGANLNLSSLNVSNGFKITGEAAGDNSGRSVASAGDVNGDGFADMIVGAPDADPHGSFSGASYVIFGRPPDSSRTRIGSAASQTISGCAFADTLKGLDGNDGLEGRGAADNLIGGAKSDTASYLHAPAGVIASLANPAINTGDAAGDSYTTVENLTGSRFDDTLIGNGDANQLAGSAGPDVETGGGGKDTFVLNAASDSPSGAGRDQITDFDAGTHASSMDIIDLSAIDAQTGPGNQAFTWIGKAAFSHTKGELRVDRAGSSAIVMGDVNGDAAADFKIELLNFAALSTLTAIDFIL